MKNLSLMLFESASPGINIQICASITENGELFIEGIDSGEIVKKLKGDWDYEYYLSVCPENKELLIVKLNKEEISIDDDEDLMYWLQENYNNSKAFSSIISLLQSLEIEHSTNFWV